MMRADSTFPELKPGTYSVKAEAQGFQPEQIGNVVSGLGQKQTVNITLKVEQSNQSVEVSGEALAQPGKRQHLHDVERESPGRPAKPRWRLTIPCSSLREP